MAAKTLSTTGVKCESREPEVRRPPRPLLMGALRLRDEAAMSPAERLSGSNSIQASWGITPRTTE